MWIGKVRSFYNFSVIIRLFEYFIMTLNLLSVLLLIQCSALNSVIFPQQGYYLNVGGCKKNVVFVTDTKLFDIIMLHAAYFPLIPKF